MHFEHPYPPFHTEYWILKSSQATSASHFLPHPPVPVPPITARPYLGSRSSTVCPPKMGTWASAHFSCPRWKMARFFPPKCWDFMGFILGVRSDLVGFHGISWDFMGFYLVAGFDNLLKRVLQPISKVWSSQPSIPSMAEKQCLNPQPAIQIGKPLLKKLGSSWSRVEISVRTPRAVDHSRGRFLSANVNFFGGENLLVDGKQALLIRGWNGIFVNPELTSRDLWSSTTNYPLLHSLGVTWLLIQSNQYSAWVKLGVPMKLAMLMHSSY